MKTALLLAACALAAACTTPPPQTAEARLAPASEVVVCSTEIPIGSTIPLRKCKTLAQIEQERADARAGLEAAKQAEGGADRIGR